MAIRSALPLLRIPCAVLLALAVSACDSRVRSGVLVGGTGEWPGGIGGVHFRSGAQEGYTDAVGGFSYERDQPVVFSIGDVELRATPGASQVSPWQLVDPGTCTASAALARLLVLVQSLDEDGDPATGTQLPPIAPGAVMRPFAALSDDDVTALVAQILPGRAPVPAADAVARFITQMDGEQWSQIGLDAFDVLDSIERSQGVATDGTYWYFSWRSGFQKTDLDYTLVAKNQDAIPPELFQAGSDHIGDIDYWDGQLYAAVEDGARYESPMIVLYDLDLVAGQSYALPNTMLTQGVPWVAVDGPRQSLYVAEWSPTPEILVFGLADVSYQRSIPLSTPLDRIQGAKVFEGALYAASDNDAKTIYKIDLETGTVIELFSFGQAFEQEGLVFLERPDGALMHTLNVALPATGVELRHHARTRAPLRRAVCP